MSKIVCLHGFLGETADFDFLAQAGMEIDAVDWVQVLNDRLAELGENAELGLDELAQRVIAERGLDRERACVLVGYSMGGRMALAMAKRLRECSLDMRLLLVSTQVGFAPAAHAARDQKRSFDAQWLKILETQPYGQFLQRWNALELFRDAKRESRPARQPSTQVLKSCFGALSASEQADFRPLLRELPPKHLIYMVGAKDRAYCALARELFDERCLQRPPQVVENASHRVLQDAPEAVLEALQQLIEV